MKGLSEAYINNVKRPLLLAAALSMLSMLEVLHCYYHLLFISKPFWYFIYDTNLDVTREASTQSWPSKTVVHK